MIDVRSARPEDHLNISVLVVNAFRQPNESNLIRSLRDRGEIAIELVAEEESALVGHIVLSRMRMPGNWLALGPVCVRRESARRGIGQELITNGLDLARRGRRPMRWWWWAIRNSTGASASSSTGRPS